MMLRDMMIDQWIKELDKEILDLQELREDEQPKQRRDPLSAGDGLPALMRQTGKDSK